LQEIGGSVEIWLDAQSKKGTMRKRGNWEKQRGCDWKHEAIPNDCRETGSTVSGERFRPLSRLKRGAKTLGKKN